MADFEKEGSSLIFVRDNVYEGPDGTPAMPPDENYPERGKSLLVFYRDTLVLVFHPVLDFTLTVVYSTLFISIVQECMREDKEEASNRSSLFTDSRKECTETRFCCSGSTS